MTHPYFKKGRADLLGYIQRTGTADKIVKRDIKSIQKKVKDLEVLQQQVEKLQQVVEMQNEKIDKIWGIVEALANQVPGASRILSRDVLRDFNFNPRGVKRTRFNEDMLEDDVATSLDRPGDIPSLRITSSDIVLEPSAVTSKPTFHRTYASEDSTSSETERGISKTMSSMSIQETNSGNLFGRSLSTMSAAAEDDYQELVRLLSGST